jgi:undecaprenyl-diphosphatase
MALTVYVAGDSAVALDTVLSADLEAFVRNYAFAVDIARIFALLGSGVVLFPLTVAVVLSLLRWHRWWALWVAVCGLGGLAISQTVKRTVDRPRPQWVDPYDTLKSASFPSGHSMAGIYGWVVFGVVALALMKGPWNRLLGVTLIVFGVSMGPSRAFLGVHWPTDVLGGWLYATAWVLTVSAVFLWWGARLPPTGSPPDSTQPPAGTAPSLPPQPPPPRPPATPPHR